MKLGVVIRILGFLLIVESVFLALAVGVSAIYKDSAQTPLLVSFFLTLLVGGGLFLAKRKTPSSDIGRKEGYAVVTIGWIVFSILGAFPFWMDGHIPSYTDAFFETMSGFTTTGSSILNDIESLPHGLLFWRSIIQWVGGMGIIVFTVALVHVIGAGGNRLFTAEVPGPVADKIHPKISTTAKRLWYIYVALTLIETLLLKAGGVGWFDAICHSFTTMATGGYSTKQASIAFWDSAYVQYVITLFMFLAGVNFTLSYFFIKGKFSKVWRDEEFRYYLSFTLIFTVLITGLLFLFSSLYSEFEESFRVALFQVVSIITTTGYATSDYLLWPPLGIMIIFVLMFLGGSAGSTGGGIKVIRIALLLKNSMSELKRLIHPKAIIPIKINGKAVRESVVNNVLAFVSIYGMIVIISLMILTSMGVDFNTTLGAVATSLGNIGPGLGSVGPAENFSHLPDGAKWYLSFLMLLGRLELFTVLVMFSPEFWKR